MSGFRPRFFIRQEGLGSDGASPLAPGSQVTLDAEDSHHASRVLRVREGDPCEVVCGRDVYSAKVVHGGQPVRLELLAHLEGSDAGAYYRVRVGLVQPITRPALIDQVLEKGTEVGTSFFLLLPPGGSSRDSAEPAARRMERWRRIVLEAAKQSKQVEVPEVAAVTSAEEAWQETSTPGATALVLHPGAETPLDEKLGQLRASLSHDPPGKSTEEAARLRQSVALWIGPEGGWSADELEWFAETGLELVRMGRSVLRTETAGPVAVALSRLVLGDW